MDRWALEWRSTSYAELRIAGGSPVRLLADSQIACDQRHRFPFRKVTPASLGAMMICLAVCRFRGARHSSGSSVTVPDSISLSICAA